MGKLTNLFRDTRSKWWLWPVAILVLLVGVFIASAISKRSRSELAKLRHAKRRAEILEVQERSDAQRALYGASAEEAINRADRIAQRITEIDADIEKAKLLHKANQHNVDLLVWADLPNADS